MKNLFFYSLLFLAVTGCKEDDEDQCCDPTNLNAPITTLAPENAPFSHFRILP